MESRLDELGDAVPLPLRPPALWELFNRSGVSLELSKDVSSYQCPADTENGGPGARGMV